MAGLIRSFDWSKTAIGPIESWSPALRMQVSFLLANRFPAAALVGADVLLDLQRRLPPGARHQAPVGARPAGERVLERDLGRAAAADRDAVQRWAGDLDRGLPARDQPPRLPRGDAFHRRLQPGARRDRAARHRRRARHRARDQREGRRRAAGRRAARPRRRASAKRRRPRKPAAVAAQTLARTARTCRSCCST